MIGEKIYPHEELNIVIDQIKIYLTPQIKCCLCFNVNIVICTRKVLSLVLTCTKIAT